MGQSHHKSYMQEFADVTKFARRSRRRAWYPSKLVERALEPGPYSPRESIPAAWDREYLRMMGRAT